MVNRVLLLILLVVLPLGAACGGGPSQGSPYPPTETPTESPALPTATPEPTPEPTQLRVAFINLMSPRSLDETDTVPGDTYEARLQLVISELKAFNPDVVAFAEATRTDQFGDTVDRLATELRMQPQAAHVNPGFVGQTEEQMRKLASEIGWQENILILVRGDRFPDLGATYKWLIPRTSDPEARRALHVKIKGPGDSGDIDLFVTHLTGGGEEIRGLQAQSFASFVVAHRSFNPAVIFADLSDGPETPAYEALKEIGLEDPFEESEVATCCRVSVIGQQEPMTDRTDYIFSWGWTPAETGTFGDNTSTLSDGTLVYPSDHLGLWAIFPLRQPGGSPGE
jgi:endonuclease/exonuclease/phosphatase family metal-dependent hydrolase